MDSTVAWFRSYLTEGCCGIVDIFRYTKCDAAKKHKVLNCLEIFSQIFSQIFSGTNVSPDSWKEWLKKAAKCRFVYTI